MNDAGGAGVGTPGEATHGASSLPDLARAGEILKQLRELWPDERFTPYVGICGQRPCVGFITDRYKSATRFTALTLEGAMARAVKWSVVNGWRIKWEAKNDDLEHPHYRRAPAKQDQEG